MKRNLFKKIQVPVLTILFAGMFFLSAQPAHAAACAGTGLELDNNGTITCLLTTPGDSAAAIALAGASSLTIVGSGNYSISGVISGTGPLTINAGAGNTLTYAAVNTYTGATTIANGTLQVGNGGAARLGLTSSAVVNAGATLAFDTTTYHLPRNDYTGRFSGAGTIRVIGPVSSATLQYNGNATAFTGTYVVPVGSRFNPNSFNSFSPNAAYTVDGLLGPQMNGFVGRMGSLSGSGSVLQGGASTGSNGLEVGNLNTDTTFAGTLGTGFSLSKIGTGTFLRNGGGAYTGDTTVMEGILGGTGGSASSDHFIAAFASIMGGTGSGNTGTYTTKDITFTDNTSQLEVSTNGTNAVSKVVATGDIDLAEVTVDITGILLTPGTYDLMTGASITGSPNMGYNQTGCASSLVTTATELQLVVTDCVPLTVTVNKKVGQADPTNDPDMFYTIVFSEEIDPSTFDLFDFGFLDGIFTDPTTADNITWEFELHGTTDGDHEAILLAGLVANSSGKLNYLSTSVDNIITLDRVAPTVTIDQDSGQTDPTTSDSIDFTAVFSKPIQTSGPEAFGCDDVSVTNGTCNSITPVSGNTYTVNITAAASGVVTATIPAAGIKDLAGNDNEVSTSADNSVTYNAPASGSSGGSSGGGGRSSGGSVQSQVANLIANDNTAAANALKAQWPNLFPAVAQGAKSVPVASTLRALMGGGEPNVPDEFKGQVCQRYLRSYIFKGSPGNVAEDVKKLQVFLNETQGSTLAVSGVYDGATEMEVSKFQAKYLDQILTPWDIAAPTGNVYRTTAAKINLMMCQLDLTSPYFPEYLKEGDVSPEVVKLQDFLNIIFAPTSGYPTAGLKLSKTFDAATAEKLREYQDVYKATVLKPWGLTTPTGWFYQTTRASANKLTGYDEGEVTLDNGVKVK